ncbi:glutathione S-transferase [Paraburkholderia youngii]|uniref:glutathione binding-like protein n=1 Tax=Paraburkholderia youngii TaxID=2782701 RepID=UPI001FE29194|nr:glutathione S-transferase C-terminal domain-containing protein [Paraburkholderia youngii]
MRLGTAERAKLQEWLGFISTELHKGVFVPLLDPDAAADVLSYTHKKVALRLNVLEQHLHGREFLLERFSVADAYLVTVLNWARYSGVELAQWPSVQQYYERTARRPSVAKAMAEEYVLYREEQDRRKAAAM